MYFDNKNLVIIVPRLHYNLKNLLLNLISDDYSITCYYFNKSNFDYENDNIATIQLRESPISRDIKRIMHKCRIRLFEGFHIPSLVHLIKIIKSKPRVIFLKGTLVFQAITAILSYMYRIEKIILYVQIPIINSNRYKNKLKLKILNLFKFAVVASPVINDSGINNDMINSINNIGRTYFLPFRFSIESANINDKIYKENTTILVVSRFDNFKRIELILKSISIIDFSFDIKLIIAGILYNLDYYNYIVSLIKEYNLEFNIEMYSNLSNAELETLYLRSDIFIHASINDPAPIVVSDAIFYGLPVICSSDNGGTSLIIDGKNGFIFNKSDVSDLSNKLLRYLNDSSLILQHSRESRRISKTLFHERFYKILFNNNRHEE